MIDRIDDKTRKLVNEAFSQIEPSDIDVPDYFKHPFVFQGRKSPIIAEKIIRTLTRKGDTVLDPFFGSGSFVVGAALADRKCVGVELDNYTYSEVAMLLKKVDMAKLDDLFSKVSDNAKDYVMNLYQTYVNGEINYIDKLYYDPEDQEYFTPKNNRDIINEQNINLAYKASDGVKKKKFDEQDLEKINSCNSIDVSRFPNHSFIENSRINITPSTGADRYDRNFTTRAKAALLKIQQAIDELPPSNERDCIEYALVASIALSKITIYGSSTDNLYHVVRYSAQESNVWNIFSDKVKAIKKYKTKLSSHLQDSFDSTQMIELHLGDYKEYLQKSGRKFNCIYTDPPYYDQVPYLEKSQYFRDWLRIFYNSKNFQLTKSMLSSEVVVSDAPSRSEKNGDNYFSDVDSMFCEFSNHIVDKGFLALTVKPGKAKYFKMLSKFMNSSRKHGFELVGQYTIDSVDPTIRKQAAYISTTLKQIVMVFQKLPDELRYWYIGEVDFEHLIENYVFNAIENNDEKRVNLKETIDEIKNKVMHDNSIILTDSDLRRVKAIIEMYFVVVNGTIVLDSNELYLGLEDQATIEIKLYNIVPILIKKLLKDNDGFTIDDLYTEIARTILNSNSEIFTQLYKSKSTKSNINNLIKNYCDVKNGLYVKREVHNQPSKDAVDISSLKGSDFEQLMKDLLYALDYKDVVVTGKSGDLGVDIIATEIFSNGSSQNVIFQCKRWIGNVGSQPIQRLHSMMTIDNRNIKRAVCLTTSGYTPDAVKIAERTGVELVDGKTIIQLLDEKFPGKYFHGALDLLNK